MSAWKMAILGASVVLLWLICLSEAKPPYRSTKPQSYYPPPERRIVNGWQMQPNQFPFQIGIESKGSGIICGGSLITKSHVLTAGHCFMGAGWKQLPTSMFTIHGGEHNFAMIEGTEQVRKIKKLKIHSKFDQTGMNDIAIIEVEPFELNKAVQIVPMAKPNSNYNQSCTVSGWGYMFALKPDESSNRADGYPDIPRFVNVDIIEKEHCKKLIEDVSDLPMDPNAICAGVLAGGKDACSADSGGPLVCKGANGQLMLVGIVGAGIGCAQKDIPGLYLEVAKMQTWIEQAVNELQ